MKTVCFNLDEQLYLEIQSYCEKTGYSQNFLIKEAIQ
jgi:hypothetical protein